MAATLQLSDLAIRPDLAAYEVSLDFLLSDLRNAKAEYEKSGAIPMSLAQAIERQAASLLAAISPPIRVVIADYERWKTAQREGTCR